MMDNECDLIDVHWNVSACDVELVRLFRFSEVLRKFPTTVYNMCNEGLLFKLYFFLLMSRQHDIKHECFILGTSQCKIPCVSFTLIPQLQ